MVNVGSQQTVTTGINATLILNGNVFALATNFRIAWGNQIVENEVSGTDIPVPSTGKFHGEGEMEIMYSTENTAANEQFASLLQPSLGAIMPVTFVWQSTDAAGNRVIFVLSGTLYPETVDYTIPGEKVTKSKLSFTIFGRPAPFSLVFVESTTYWDIYASSSWYNSNPSVLAPLAPYLDRIVAQVASDLGYNIFNEPPLTTIQKRLALVVYPPANDGSSTGTMLGLDGITVVGDSTTNVYDSIASFWWYILTLHETVNVWTGTLATDWVWADGSSLWAGTSLFPTACDIIITNELGYPAVSAADAARFTSDPGVQLFLSLHSTYGWAAFQQVFALVERYGITDWGVYPEPLRTAILTWFFSRATGVNQYSAFNAVTVALSGNSITNAAYAQAQAMFLVPTVSVSPTSVPQGNALSWTATGFAPNSPLTMVASWTGTALEFLPSPVTNSSGAASGSFVVGTNIPVGNVTLTLTDSTGNTASATFTVTGPTITVNWEVTNSITNVGINGATVTMTSTGNYGGPPAGTVYTGTTNSSGLATMPIPAGEYYVTISATGYDSWNNNGATVVLLSSNTTPFPVALTPI